MKTLRIISFLVAFSLFLSGYSKPDIKGSGNVISENREVSSFSRLVVSDAIEVIISPADKESVSVEAEDNLLPYVIVEMNGDKLHIKMKENQSISTEKGVKVHVSYKQIAELFVSGASKLSSTGSFKAEKFLLILSGASQAELDIQSQWLSVNCSGASKGTISGNTEKLNIQCSGASNVNAQKLSSKDVDVEASGASNVCVDASEKLNIAASGASMVRYLCDASTAITRNISGASSAVSLDEGGPE